MTESQYLQLSQQKLTEFAQSNDFASKMEVAFGTKIDRTKLAELGNRWQQGDFGELPAIEVLQNGELGTASGAYAAVGNTIYLSSTFLATASTEQIVDVLIEEIGHFVDGVLNTADAAGDEGAIFSGLVQGYTRSNSEILSLQAENDHASITVNGQQVLVERADVTGDNNDNVLNGTAGDDVISGLAGNDTISGLEGNDRLVGGSGSDTFTGGAGNDVIVLENFNSDTTPTARDLDVVTDFVRGQDKIDVSGLGINDFNTLLALTADDATNSAIITTRNNVLDGFGYSLKITGIKRNDLTAADFTFATASVNDIISGTTNNDDLFGGLGNDTLSGGAGNDRLFGEQGDDRLVGGSGSDTFTGGVGNDVIVLENFNSGATAQDLDVVTDFVRGQDKIDVSGLGINDFNTLLALTADDATNSAVITTRNNVFDGGFGYSLKITGIKRNDLTAADFTFATDTTNDSLTGSARNDDLFGGLGNDTLSGAAGNDRLFGEQGDDRLIGGSGSDTFTGGAGNDTIALENFNSDTTARDLDVVTDFVRGQDKIDVSGLGINDFNTLLALTADDATNSAVITTRNNVFDGGFGYSLKITGIKRNDLTAADFTFATGTTNDELLGSTRNDDLFGGLGNDTLSGAAGNDRLFGEQGDDRLIGGSGSDTFTGGAGNDTIALENFNSDTTARDLDVVTDFVRGQDKIDVSGLGINDFNTLLALTADDATNSAVITTRNNVFDGGFGYSLKITGIKRNDLTAADFTFATGTTNDSLTGSTRNDDLFGGLGNDTLTGGDGNDRLFGEQGDDRLIGGSGSDTFTGGAGNDTIALENFNSDATARDLDVVTDFVRGQDKIDVSGLGISDFSTLLALTANDASDSAVITTRNNVFDGFGYSLKITGINRNALTAADFTFATGTTNDSLTGSTRNDDLFGGLGNDTLTGGDGNDRLFGEQGDDTLNGGAGDDLLKGQSGIDILTGGTGKDTFDLTGYNTLGNGDYAIVKDFNPTDDKLILDGAAAEYTFSTSPIAGVTGASLFRGTELIAIFENITTAPVLTGTGITFIPAAVVLQRGVLNLSSPTYSVDENGVTTAAITVTRTGGSEGVVGATVTPTNGTAIAPDDYNNAPITVTFANGDAVSKTITIPIVADGVLEPNETVNLTLATPTGGATIGSQASAVLTIIDRTIVPVVLQPGVLSFNSPTYTIGEDGSTVAAVTVTRTSGSDGVVSAIVTLTDGTAIAPGDYNNAPITVTFASGDAASKTVTIPIFADAVVEPPETVNLTLATPTGGATIGSQGAAVLTIADRTPFPTPGSLSFGSPSYSTVEGSGVATVTVTRTGGTQGAVSTTLTSRDGTATAPADYTNTSIDVNFADGDGATKTITIPIVNDALIEFNETVQLSLSVPVGGATLGGGANLGTSTLTIIDDDIIPLIASTANDPHLKTFDRLGYDFQAVGEFTLVKSTTDDFEIQTRQKPFNNSTSASANSAIAINSGGQKISLYANGSQNLVVNVNGAAVTLADGGTLTAGQNTIGRQGNQYRIITANQDLIQVNDRGSFLNINLGLAENRKGKIVGLLGNNNGNNSDEFTLRDGTAIGATIPSERLYGDYGNSWRITQPTSLFDYVAGTDTSTFTNLNFPAKIVTLGSLTPEQRATAEATARAAGITDPALLNDAIVDIFLTDGAPEFIQGAVEQQQVVASLLATIAPFPVVNPVVVALPPVTPSVIAPPVVAPPVTPPVAIDPPVVAPPVTPPVAIDPPAIDPPVVAPPVTPPVAIDPPVVAPPATPPVAIDPPVVAPPATPPVAIDPPVLAAPAAVARPQISILTSDDEAAETKSGQPQNLGQFSFKRTGSIANALTVQYTIEGSATNGTDYNKVENTVAFAAGSDTTTIEINPIDDRIYEGTETVTLKLNGSDSYTIAGENSGTLNIKDNDARIPKLIEPTPSGLEIEGGTDNSVLKFTKIGQEGVGKNEVLAFTVDDERGRIGGIAPGASGYLGAALDRAQVVFSSLGGNGVNVGFDRDSQRYLNFAPGERVQFALVANDTLDAVKANLTDRKFTDKVLFSLAEANAGRREQAKFTAIPNNGGYEIAWEDNLLEKNAAPDFNDLVLKVETLDNFKMPVGTSLQSKSEGSVIDLRGFAGQTLKVDTVSTSDAAYQNYIGFYAVEDAQGTLANGLKVGDAGYAKAAIQSAILRGFKTEAQSDLAVTGGKILAPVVIANGTFEDFLNKNPQNQANSSVNAYFNYIGANTDKVDHFRLLGDNKFGVEDIYGGGDRDYNDIVVQLTVKG